MNLGWIKIHRKMTEWEWFTDPNTAHLFIYLLLMAYREPKKWRGIDIPAGSFVTSREKLSTATGLTERQVRTALKHLETTGEVTKKTTKQYTLLTVVNYFDYQSSDQVSDQQATNKRPTSDQQATTIKNQKKERKKESKNLDDHSGQAADDDSDEPFDFCEAIKKEFDNPEVVQALKAFWNHWRKKPKKEEATKWIKTLQMFPDDETRLESIRYSSGSTGKWYRDIYSSGFSEPKKDSTKPNLPDWYDITPTEKGTQEDVDKILELQEKLLVSGGKGKK